MSEFGILSIVPPVLAVVLAIVTRRAILSLFLGVWAGAVIYTGGFGLEQTFEWIASSLIGGEGSELLYLNILIFTLLLGSGVALIWRLGGSQAVQTWASKRIQTQQQAGIATWVLGIGLFFDDYANTAIVGNTMKDISDQLRVSREKLSYIVDSTAAPIATLSISSWVAFQLSQIEAGYAETDATDIPSATDVFISSLPYNMYAILAIMMVGIIVISGRDYGEMLGAEHRASTTGKVNRDGARPMQDVEGELGDPSVETPRLIAFLGPILSLIIVTLATAAWTGYDATGSAGDIIENADYTLALIFGSFAMVVSGYIIGYWYDILSLDELVETTLDGFKLMLTAVTILVLAWSIGTVVGALETGNYVGTIAEENLPLPFLPNTVTIPVVIFAIAGFIAFSTGSAWSTMAIVTPIAIPVAWSVTGDHEVVAATVGVIFSGAVFGDHSSPISDTSVMSATFTGADLIDHVRTQIYYAVTVAGVAIVLWTIWGVTGINPVFLLPVGVMLLAGIVYAFSQADAARRGINPQQRFQPGKDQPTRSDD